jgi:hypothetical protein
MKLEYYPVLASIFLLSLRCGFGQAPVNDYFTNRTVLSGDDVSFIGTLAGATTEDPQELTGDGLTLSGKITESVWWSWTTPQDSVVTLVVSSSSTNTEFLNGLSVYDTTNVFSRPIQIVSAKPLVSSIPNESFSFPVTAGTEYEIQLFGGTSATYALRLISSPFPIILDQPKSQTVSSNASAIFTVMAAGIPPFWYQWQFNGTNLPDATKPILGLTNILASQAGSYLVIVSNAGGTVTSDAATLALSASDIKPVLTVRPNQSVQFAFSVSGETGRNYRIESSTNLVDWLPEASFPETSYSGYQPQNTSVVFTTNSTAMLAVGVNGPRKYFRASSYAAPDEICINNLKQIRYAKMLWQRETMPALYGGPTLGDLDQYMTNVTIFSCPGGGLYQFNNVVGNPTCTVPGHVLEEPR